MRYFYYVHTGHRIGLDRFRRAATMLRWMSESKEKGGLDLDVTLLSSDYRIAQIAREYDIKRAVGLDVVRNIPQISHHGDKLFFDSAEHNPMLHQDMVTYFSTFIRMSDSKEDSTLEKEFIISPYFENSDTSVNATIVDERYFQTYEKTIEVAFYFGDDDYEEDLLKNIDMFRDIKMELLLGFYFFLGYEEKLKEVFFTQHENEDYDAVITKSKVFISCSPQAILESLASGGRPIFIQRDDYPRDYIELFKSLNIPIVDGYNKDELLTTFNTVLSHNYHEITNNKHKVNEFVKKCCNL
jgi:hypothetical protein